MGRSASSQNARQYSSPRPRRVGSTRRRDFVLAVAAPGAAKMSKSVWLLMRWTAAAVIAVTVQKWISKCWELERKLEESEAALKSARKERQAERTGRIRAQRELKDALVSKGAEDASTTAFPMTPIGTVRSCFSTRNGTPRQPLLVTHARSCVVLHPGGIPLEALDGLTQYSHCWLLYVFHDNTDLQRLWTKPGHREFKAKVHVPRLDGKKLGVFATRTPHRPCPIGLSIVKIEGVHGGMLLLSGADIVDGTPVLDIKPYLPYCDSVPVASAPSWVQAGGPDDVLAVQSVEFSEKFLRDLADCWNLVENYSLYSSPEDFQRLLKQVLSRDIRSLNQRQRPHTATLSVLSDIVSRGCSGLKEPEEGHTAEDTQQTTESDFAHQLTSETFGNGEVLYNLLIEGVNVTYTQDTQGRVLVKSATVLQQLNKLDLRSCRRFFSN